MCHRNRRTPGLGSCTRMLQTNARTNYACPKVFKCWIPPLHMSLQRGDTSDVRSHSRPGKIWATSRLVCPHHFISAILAHLRGGQTFAEASNPLTKTNLHHICMQICTIIAIIFNFLPCFLTFPIALRIDWYGTFYLHYRRKEIWLHKHP